VKETKEHYVEFIEDRNNMFLFKVDGQALRIYAECYMSACKKLQSKYDFEIVIH
jgi:hypothetical protein